MLVFDGFSPKGESMEKNACLSSPNSHICRVFADFMPKKAASMHIFKWIQLPIKKVASRLKISKC